MTTDVCMERPTIDAFDKSGIPETRKAATISELPIGLRDEALESATEALARHLQLAVQRRIGYGTPVHLAFGLTRNQAKMHPGVKLLLSDGGALSLDHCPIFDGGR